MATVVIEAGPAVAPVRAPSPPRPPSGALAELRNYVRSQVVNAKRHGRAVRSFEQAEFGDGPTAPRSPNIEAVNKLLAEVATLQSPRTSTTCFWGDERWPTGSVRQERQPRPS